MYYTAQAEIQIGKVKIHGATEVEIESSVDAIGGTAKITLPRNWMRSDGEKLLGQISTEFQNTILNATDKTTFVPDKKFFAPPPMLKFDRAKKITATAIAGSDNVVVEDFGLGQWDITMNGLLVDMESHQYPTTKVQRFRQLFETPDVYDVLQCQVMTDLGINALYFYETHGLTVLETYPDTVKYELKAKSIQPPEFTISN